MQAADQPLEETYLLLAGFFADGTPMDQEQIRDLLDLNCISTQPTQVNTQGFEDAIEQLRQTIGVDVQERNATFYLQQEELIDAARLDLKATFDARIRDYHTKETTAAKAARKAKNTAEQLKLTREARSWRRKAEEADDEYRRQRDKLRDESDAYLDKASMALEPKEETNELFTVSWEVS